MEPNNKSKKVLAEDCFKIRLSNFGKKLLYAVDTEKMDSYDLLCNKENKTLKGKQGYFVIRNGSASLNVSYSVDQNRMPKVLKIRFQNEKSEYNGAEQDIALEEDITTFGIRPFFSCSCGRHATVLYKLPDEYVFKCRSCANITYESQRISRYTLKGALYHTHRLIKLAKLQEGIKRMFYGGGLSRKGRRFIAIYNNWNGQVNMETRIKAENHLLSVAKEGSSINKDLAQFL